MCLFLGVIVALSFQLPPILFVSCGPTVRTVVLLRGNAWPSRSFFRSAAEMRLPERNKRHWILGNFGSKTEKPKKNLRRVQSCVSTRVATPADPRSEAGATSAVSTQRFVRFFGAIFLKAREGGFLGELSKKVISKAIEIPP